MVIGTMLGDASLWTLSRHPRYRATHGLPQKGYCAEKERILKDFIRTPMKVYPNGGYGEFTARFDTLTSPEFDFLIPLCFRKDPTTGKLKKTVTPEWVAELTWEAVAWWFMDDGCKQATALMISTHSFAKEEVDLLAGWLTDHGCPTHAHLTRKGATKHYYILKIPTESARTFEENVSPFILPSMRYKLEDADPRGQTLSCTFCGSEFLGNGKHQGGQGKFPCCQAKKCRKAAGRARAERALTSMGGGEGRYQKDKARLLAKTPEQVAEHRRRINEQQNARLLDPVTNAKFNQRKRKRRAVTDTPEKRAIRNAKEKLARDADPDFYAKRAAKRALRNMK